MKKSLTTKGVVRKVVKTPGGKKAEHFKRTLKPGKKRCSACGKELHGVKLLSASKMKNTPKSKKTANRPFSNLCSHCMRKKILEKIKTTFGVGKK